MADMTQATFLKISAIAVAAPRYAGALAAAVGIDAIAKYPLLIPAEVIAGLCMAVLEGWAMAYVLGKWRLLRPKSTHWYTLLFLSILLALTLPLVSAPYLVASQSEMAINELFNSNFWQFSWSFIVAAVPVLIVMAVGVASQDSSQFDEVKLPSQKQSGLTNQKRSKIIIGQPKLTTRKGSENGQLSGQKKINQRRQKVANLDSQNYSQKEIAKRLKCSVSTVKNDLKEIAKKWTKLKFQEGQIIKDHCCTGFNWEIRYIMNEETVWGKCLNPNCPNVCGCGDPCDWDGIGFFEVDDYCEKEIGKNGQN